MQLILDFKLNDPKINKADLIVGKHNQEVVNFLFQQFKNSIHKVLFIYGNKAVGKSYISKLYLKENKGRHINFNNIDDVFKIDNIIENNSLLLLEDINHLSLEQEKNLFNLYNVVMLNNTRLILTAEQAPTLLNLQLPDLQSRLINAMAFKINEPEELAFKQLLFKLFQDYQLQIDMTIVEYILKRVERKAESIKKVVLDINNLVAVNKKTISINLIKQVI